MIKPLLQVRLQAAYKQQQVLKDIQFDLNPGEALGFVGTSGAGKSTLVLSLLGLLPWKGGRATGEVLLDGQNLLTLSERQLRRIRGKKIALVPQSPMSALNSAVSIRRHFEEAWRAHESGKLREFHTRVETLLTEVQLPATKDFLARRPNEISVGQAQRVMIALALLHRPAILIADEPTSALDPVTQAEIIKLLRHLNQTTGAALLYISHDLISVLQLCHRLAVLDSGLIAETISVADIASAHHPSTLSLLESLPVPAHLLLSRRQQPPLTSLRPNRWNPRPAKSPEKPLEELTSAVGAWWTP